MKIENPSMDGRGRRTMKIRPTGTAYFLMAIFIMLVVFLMYSLTYDEFRTKFMPALVSAITLVLTVVALIQ